MKLQSNNLLESLTNRELKILTTEIKETVCRNFKKEKGILPLLSYGIFSVAEETG